MTSDPLPDFTNPPIIEVALSVLYESLPALSAGHIGTLWSEFRDEFPVTEDQPPLSFPIEQPALVDREPRPEMTAEFPKPRTWFLNASGTELIQVQHDRFAYNWRKREPSGAYPRYPKVRENFERHLRVFKQFLSDSDLGTMTPRQCEVSYVNHFVEEGGLDQGRVADYVSLWQDLGDSSGLIAKPERVAFDTSYAMSDAGGRFLGRLRLSLRPATLKANGWSILVLTLTARGNLLTQGDGGVLGFLDVGREWIVRAFTEVTTPRMHAAWRRLQ